MDGPLVVVGDLLLDLDVRGSVSRLCPDAPVPVLDGEQERVRPGGAGLAAVLAAADFRSPVRLVTALATDLEAQRLRALLAGTVELVAAAAPGTTPVKCRMLAGGRPLLRLDRGGLGPPRCGPDVIAALADAAAVVVSDYGRGFAADPGVVAALVRAARRVPVVWDPHPRGVVPVSDVSLVTPNLGEAEGLAGAAGVDAPDARAERAARLLLRRWRCDGVAVTLGGRGALLATPGGVSMVGATPVVGGDPCGAGDRFAVAAAAALAAGAAPDEAVTAAVTTASTFVAAGGAGALRRGPDGRYRVGTSPPEASGRSGRSGRDAAAVVAEVRARGGTVVATGGCFDLLHAGHARTLTAARGMGDCLVVCLNSDASVRRLKGPGRPVVAQVDRAELLAALGCVDAVVVFEEDSPAAVLAALRPDVWVKGGDYAADELPEAPLVRSWGGRVVAVPYHAGRSSTRLVAAAATAHDETTGREPTR